MTTRTYLTLAVLLAVTILAVGCSPAPEATQAPAAAPLAAPTTPPRGEAPAGEQEPLPTAAPTPAPASGETPVGGYTPVSLPNRPNRLIVKNAELKLLVADTDVAIDRVTQIAADSGGYIISSRVRYDEWLGEKYKYASITIGVPVDQFEVAMRRLRNLALMVVDETASGQDVTDEYVDLQSRLDNLIATRDRIRQFLDQAQTVEESLRVNEQLSAIEEQIEQVEGRMNYLFDRSAYSTITVQIDPELPQPTPAPTPMPTATPTPVPTPTPTPTPTPIPPWTPVQTVHAAGSTLTSILRILARVVTEITIWVLIVVLPLLGPPVLAVWAIGRWSERRHRRRVEP